MSGFFEVMSFSDIVMCAIIAFFATGLIRSLPAAFRLFKHEARLSGNPAEVSKVIERCYALFPLDSVMFKGETFKRGMYVKVTTTNSKTIEGKLIGINHDNILCIITKTAISAEIMNNISGITLVDKEPK